MTPKSVVREDNRLNAMPMVPVACESCGARVLARKSSWNQTSVQWNAEATDRCAELADARRLAPHSDRFVFLACSALGAAIHDAVRRGVLAVVDENGGAATPSAG